MEAHELAMTCTVCGYMIEGDFNSESTHWLKTAVLLSTGTMQEGRQVLDKYVRILKDETLLESPAAYIVRCDPSDSTGATPTTEPPSEIFEISAKAIYGPYFVIPPPGDSPEGWPTACRVETEIPLPLHIPMHGACLQVAKAYIAWRGTKPALASTTGSINSMHALWDVLLDRVSFAGALYRPEFGNFLISICYPPSPRDYFGTMKYHPIVWADHDRAVPTDALEQALFQSDPCAPGLATQAVLDALAARRSNSNNDNDNDNDPSAAAVASSLAAVPQELQDSVAALVFPLDNRPAPTHILQQHHWRQALLARRALPWLWDVDAAALEEQEKGGGGGVEADWEAVVRQLSGMAFKWEAGREEAVPGLVNRRRIWVLLDEGRVGDTRDFFERHPPTHHDLTLYTLPIG